MKRACPCLAGAAALALALVVANVPAPAVAAPEEKVPKRDLDSPYADTTIGAVIDANEGKMPASGTELVAALAKLGDFVQLPIAFSAVALDSGLTHPRVVFALRPSTTPAPVRGSRWSPTGPPPQLLSGAPAPLNTVAANRTQLQGRLFLAANATVGEGGLSVRTVEFISWNTKKLKFDFGVIEGLNTDGPKLTMLDGVRCFSCHKGRGPILGNAPWSNTAHNPAVRDATATALSRVTKLPNGGEVRIGGQTDGLWLDDPHGVEVDAAVRFGAELLRDRAAFKRLAETPDTRKALVLLFETVLMRGPLEKNDKAIQNTIDALVPARLARDARTAKLNGPHSMLRDYSPGGKTLGSVTVYNEARERGSPRLPSEFLPSNPKAFAEPVKPSQRPSDYTSAIVLAQTMGLSEKDREFLTDKIDEAVKRLKTPALTATAVANAVLTGPAFADVLATGALPDRDDFKDRFVTGLAALLKQHGQDEFAPARDTYASAPKFDPSAKEEKAVATLPSHACLACHDVPGARKAAFNPIPQLAFDPFDATARAEWLKFADRKSKAEVLGRMLKRLGTDSDMPPVDSKEYELYRAKDPVALNAVKDWLNAELKKVK